MRDKSHSCVSRPFPFPAFPGLDFRGGNLLNALHEKDNACFQDFSETQPGNGVETAEILVSTFPYILRIYGGAFTPPTIYEATNATPPITEILIESRRAMPTRERCRISPSINHMEVNHERRTLTTTGSAGL